MIPIDQCEDRRLYKIDSRNLSYGVYRAATKGFIGIRTKFCDRFLFEEYHWDTGEPHGTVRPEEATEHVLPEDIKLSESLGSECTTCGKPVEFVQVPDAESIVGKDSHWKHLEATDCDKVRPCRVPNKALFDWIEEKTNGLHD